MGTRVTAAAQGPVPLHLHRQAKPTAAVTLQQMGRGGEDGGTRHRTLDVSKDTGTLPLDILYPSGHSSGYTAWVWGRCSRLPPSHSVQDHWPLAGADSTGAAVQVEPVHCPHPASVSTAPPFLQGFRLFFSSSWLQVVGSCWLASPHQTVVTHSSISTLAVSL